MSAELIPTESGFALKGELDFVSVPDLYERSYKLLSGLSKPVTVDLEAVTRSNSAGLALLVAMARHASSSGAALQIKSVPPQLMALVHANKLEGMLGLANKA